MNIFDVVGPVMVGPSSSHTAGAVRIGNICKKLMRDPIASAKIYLHGSFLLTGKGHGTDRAVVAGLLGFEVDDERIPDSFEEAKKAGLDFIIEGTDLGDVHPNSVKIEMESAGGRRLEVVASSVGGGRICINKIDGIDTNFAADYPTLIVHNVDSPGHVTGVTGMLGRNSINIAAMQLYRKSRGGEAVMVIECDEEVNPEALKELKDMDGVIKVTYLSLC
ncbi:MAG: L-serine ammonia-lyase, iron-sulfur-dependent subunit beta [Eubacterium sp.]|nr:L-serine ammonia-lyase, iron-sulfur-dependent subunit beta [Eubacterium sp.]